MSASQATAQPGHARSWVPFTLILVLLLSVYGTWLLTYWPGILGMDSFAILRQVEQPDVFTSSKPAFWYWFVAAFYRSTRLVEVPVAIQLLFSATVFARILSWQWVTKGRRMRWVFAASLPLICCAPNVVFYINSLNPDGIFSVAASGLLFELWLAARRRLSVAGLVMIALTLPVALFARSNGLAFLLPVSGALFLVDKAGRWWLAGIALAWCSVVAVGTRNHRDVSQSVLYPLAIFETVNFLQPHPMKLWMLEPPISAPTIELLTKHWPVDKYLAHYDPDYWDSLMFDADGPQVGAFPDADKDTLVQEFFRYNLWHNIPAFMGSRANVFLAAATARAGIVSHAYARLVLTQLHSLSEYRRFHLNTMEYLLNESYELSFRHRWLLWSPLPAMALLLWLLRVGLHRRDAANLLVTVPMVLQLGGIFLLSIAAEYRYLLPFFILPVLLLPMLVLDRKSISDVAAPVRPAT